MLFLVSLYSLTLSTLEGEYLPSPVFGVRDISNPVEHLEILQNNSNQVYDFNGDAIGPSDTLYGANRSLFYSFISINNSEFLGCSALGTNMVYGSGGAVYAFTSHVQIVDSIFTGNEAMVGGALSLSRSSLIINGNVSFTRNVAKYICGAICASDTPKVSIINVQFVENTAFGRYGAIGCNNITSVTLDHCNFEGNSANHSGGALGFQDCGVYISGSKFFSNSVILPKMSFNYIMRNNDTEALRRLNDQPPGGGAIVFKVSPRGFTGLCWERRHLTTIGCCFNDNILDLGVFADISTSLLVPYNRTYLNSGADIFFFGFSLWRSEGDKFSLKEEYAIKKPEDNTSECFFNSVTSRETVFGVDSVCNVTYSNNFDSTYVQLTHPPVTPQSTNPYMHTMTPKMTTLFIEPTQYATPSFLPYTLNEDRVPSFPCPSQTPSPSQSPTPVLQQGESMSVSYSRFEYTTVTRISEGVHSETVTVTYNAIFYVMTPSQEENDTLIYVIIGSVAGVLVLGAIGYVLTVYLSPKKSDDDSQGPDNTVTPIHYLDTDSTVITQDNPLYLSGQSNLNSDDPFASDFSDKDIDVGFTSTAL